MKNCENSFSLGFSAFWLPRILDRILIFQKKKKKIYYKKMHLRACRYDLLTNTEAWQAFRNGRDAPDVLTPRTHRAEVSCRRKR